MQIFRVLDRRVSGPNSPLGVIGEPSDTPRLASAMLSITLMISWSVNDATIVGVHIAHLVLEGNLTPSKLWRRNAILRIVSQVSVRLVKCVY